MYVDNELIFFNDTAVAAKVDSTVLDLGTTGGWVHPLYIDVKLSNPVTSGTVDTITLQSSDTKAFTSPVDEVTITVPKSIDQKAHAATLAQFFAPIKTGNRYVRLEAKGTTPVGGKLYACLVNGVSVGM